MLSNKMTVSLMSFITILALAFVATPAMAGTFGTLLSVDDVSFAAGGQVEAIGINDVMVHIKFDHVVTIEDVKKAFGADATVTDPAKKGVVDIFNTYGAIIDTTANILEITTRQIETLATSGNQRHDGMNYTLTIADVPAKNTNDPLDKNTHAVKIRVFMAEGAVPNANPGDPDVSAQEDITFDLVGEDPDPSLPMPVSIALPDDLLIPDAGFTGDKFDIVVTLSEQPKENKLTKDHFTVDKGTAADGVYLKAIEPIDGGDEDMNTDNATGRSDMHQQFLVTITPKAEDGNLVIKLQSFEDQEILLSNGKNVSMMPGPNKYNPPYSDFDRVEGVDMLTVKIKRATTIDKVAGLSVGIANDKVIPNSGYLVIAKDEGGSAVIKPGGDQAKPPMAHERTPAQMGYNLITAGLPNLETFLANGGTVDLVAPEAGVVISEIMWGSDASLGDSFKSQYIEIRNTSGKELKTGGDSWKLIFYAANETLPNVSTVKDRVGTIGASGYWSIAGKGQSGRTGVGEAPGDQAAVTPTQALVSMQRIIDATGAAADGTMASSWAASTPPGLNFKTGVEGTRVGSPGAAPVAYPTPPAPEPAPVTVPVAQPADIMITEIMVDTGDGRLPQWIELTNVSGAEKSLAGWSLAILNTDADADVIGATVSINLSGTLGVGGGEDAGGTMGKSLLLVGGSARSSSNLAGSDRVVDISSQVAQRGRYAFISTMAFMAALIPPQTTGVLAYGDTAGNLDDGTAAWELPMSENGRSSLIRREILEDGMATMGTDANGWVLASSTSLVSGPATWYGSDEDAGTPGYDAGGPLPVELSHFRPARDNTGAVVITWSTQSELNNAGFFIKRSQQRDGQFTVINPTMIPGAGTTSEKRSYTYTDTTAQPNVVYYYQIEDVSLDGNRQTLTHGIRLKGHIGAAGKLTTTWGDLKTSNE